MAVKIGDEAEKRNDPAFERSLITIGIRAIDGRKVSVVIRVAEEDVPCRHLRARQTRKQN